MCLRPLRKTHGHLAIALEPGLLKVVNDYLFADRFEDFLDELQMKRVHLVIVLRMFTVEYDIECHLIGLVHDRTLASSHLTDMKMNNSRERRQILICSRD